MPRIKPDIESFARIKVVGVGGSGENALDHMIRSKVRGVGFIAINTDAQDLHNSLAGKKIHIGKNTTRGLGAGMNPDLGRKAAEETKTEIAEALKGADMVFIACGFGGGTGTGAAPIVADIAREAGALAIAVVTRPFAFEGSERNRIAEEGLRNLTGAVDAMIVIPNDKLLDVIDRKTPFLTAFAMCDEVLRHAVEGIADLITLPGIINVDFADVKAILQNTGHALMGIGVGHGEHRAKEAASRAVNSPLLDISLDGARGVLFSVAGGPDLTMWEVHEAAKVITEPIAKEAKVIFGAVHDERLSKGEIKITVIAAGFSNDNVAAVARSPKLFPEPSLKPKGNDNNSTLPSKQAKSERSEDQSSEWDMTPAFLRRQNPR